MRKRELRAALAKAERLTEHAQQNVRDMRGVYLAAQNSGDHWRAMYRECAARRVNAAPTAEELARHFYDAARQVVIDEHHDDAGYGDMASEIISSSTASILAYDDLLPAQKRPVLAAATSVLKTYFTPETAKAKPPRIATGFTVLKADGSRR